MEEAEAVMKIIDRCWFELEIFKKRPDTSPSSTSRSNPSQESIEIPEKESSCLQISRTPSILVRSVSDQTSIIPTSLQASSLSPDSVLPMKPIHSMIYEEEGQMGGRAKRRTLTKSLSELEFEELKGFVDLGFVFLEEDRVDSSLVSIISGLCNIIKDGEEDDEDGDEKLTAGESVVVARPYLSEAWKWWEEKGKEDPLMKWKVPSLGNETDIKESQMVLQLFHFIISSIP
ncbi:hypothetical protein EUGRSUZ_E02782 [Eucalyptus grandis]|uniref:Uncharacterized protein n=2 Tax=Eucalyptus grandis TaxID=71139 RepID=A0ACC3KYM8_EUCGR|nr:hypothetical protein EUGRSUZ_E02782 [Eucalyptus grandis]